MRNTKMFHTALWGWLAIIVVAPLPAAAQTYFDKNVSAGATTTFEELTTFSTPTGAGPNRKTMARVITTTPATDVTFKIVTPAGKSDPEIPVPGAGAVDMDVTGEPVTTNFNTKVSAVPVAAGFAMILVTIEYDASFDFGMAAETWSLQVRRGAADRRFIIAAATGTDVPGGTNDVEVLATRSKVAVIPTVIPTLNFGDVQVDLLDDSLAPVKSYTIQNVGTGPLTITGGSLIPPAGAYTIVTLGGFVPAFVPVDPMATFVVPIRFKPTSPTGPKDLMMSIASDDPDPDMPVSFSGRGSEGRGVEVTDICQNRPDLCFPQEICWLCPIWENPLAWIMNPAIIVSLLFLPALVWGVGRYFGATYQTTWVRSIVAATGFAIVAVGGMIGAGVLITATAAVVGALRK